LEVLAVFAACWVFDERADPDRLVVIDGLVALAHDDADVVVQRAERAGHDGGSSFGVRRSGWWDVVRIAESVEGQPGHVHAGGDAVGDPFGEDLAEGGCLDHAVAGESARVDPAGMSDGGPRISM